MFSGTLIVTSVLVDLPVRVRLEAAGGSGGGEVGRHGLNFLDLPSGQLGKLFRFEKLSHLGPRCTLCCSQAREPR